MKTALGSYIQDRRKAQGYRTQSEFADAIEMNRAHLSQVESGKIGMPSPDARRRIAKALGVSHIDLLIAAGELSEDEVRKAGVEGAVEGFFVPQKQFIDLMAAVINWDYRTFKMIEAKFRDPKHLPKEEKEEEE